jgi:2-isopropylmalate synthase
LEIARKLEKLKVDVIEAGFPVSSPGDFEAVSLISKEVRNSAICGLSHANPQAIDRAWEAVKEASHPRIHIFLSSSNIHLLHQLKKTRDEILKTSRDMVARAKKYTSDIEFSPMDASRTEPKYLYQILEAVIAAGALPKHSRTVGMPSGGMGQVDKGIFQSTEYL